MKYICEDLRTQSYLVTWARGSELLVSNHFFWNSGSPLQKSQIGLIRGILPDALRKYPRLAPIVLSADWSKLTTAYSTKNTT